MRDTLAPDQAELAQTAGPRSDLPPLPPDARSFGFAQVQPADTLAEIDCTGMTYDPVTQMTMLGGVTAVERPEMKTNTPHRTTEDHKSWMDSDTDKSVSDDA